MLRQGIWSTIPYKIPKIPKARNFDKIGIYWNLEKKQKKLYIAI